MNYVVMVKEGHSKIMKKCYSHMTNFFPFSGRLTLDSYLHLVIFKLLICTQGINLNNVQADKFKNEPHSLFST